MAVDLARYLVSLEVQSAKYVQELDKANKKLDRFHKDQERAVAGIKKAFLNIGTSLAAAFSIRSIVNFTTNAIKAADAIGETARAAGFSAERFQRLQFVFGQSGVEANEFGAAMRTLNTRLGQFITTGAGPAAKAIERLGLRQRVLKGEINTSEKLFDAVAASLSHVGGSAEQAAVLAALFGKEMGARMAAQMGIGIEAINAAADAVEGVFNDETIAKADALADAWNRLATARGNVFKSLSISAAFDVSKLFGLKEATEGLQALEIQLAALKDQRDAILLTPQRDVARQAALAPVDKQIEAIKKQIEYEKLINTPFIQPRVPDIKPVKDGLEEISTSFGKLPADLKKFDFAGALNTVQFKEISDVLVKMPADLQKLSPEFNNAVVANQRYIETLKETDDKQKQLAQSMGSAFEDAFTGWILGAERSFKDFLERMAVQFATSALFRSLGSLFPGGSFLSNFFDGARANGGPVSAGRSYLVGENGPEIFTPNASGQILAGAGGFTYNDNTMIDARGADPSLLQRLPQILAAHRQQTKAEIQELRRRGRF